MLQNGIIWIGKNEAGEAFGIRPEKANRHGLIAGATGTGKTVTLKVLAEAFSDMGVPVFLADVKGDLAGMVAPGEDSESISSRVTQMSLGEVGFSFHSYPATFWDIYGKNGIQLRTTISEMGPLLLAKVLNLNELQSSILSIIFKLADDNGLLLIDTKDLKAIINHVRDNRDSFAADYGKMSPASLDAILRAVVALETNGGEIFFGEPALNVQDWFSVDAASGRGMIHILDSQTLVNNSGLYSTFLLWMLSELFETLPEVGDLDKPKMVFFFDEAHLLFDGAPKELLEKIEQVVKLIRSKGVGVYFITQNPRDIPDGVLAQLSNRIQHGLRAYSPAEQKAVKAAADSFRENPAFKTLDTILALGIGEAVVSFLDESGVPQMAQKVTILPPQSHMGQIPAEQRQQTVKASLLYARYAQSVDPDSAYEFLMRKGEEEAAAAAKEAAEAAAAKAAAKQAAAEEKAASKQAAKATAAQKRVVKSVGNSVAGTVGRELGKSVGASFGKFGKTLGGNVGASLGRGLLSTFLKG